MIWHPFLWKIFFRLNGLWADVCTPPRPQTPSSASPAPLVTPPCGYRSDDVWAKFDCGLPRFGQTNANLDSESSRWTQLSPPEATYAPIGGHDNAQAQWRTQRSPLEAAFELAGGQDWEPTWGRTWAQVWQNWHLERRLTRRGTQEEKKSLICNLSIFPE